VLKIDMKKTPDSLKNSIDKVFELSATKIRDIHEKWNPGMGSPVFTANGRYITRGWTDWTQGFQFGCALLQFDGTGEKYFLKIGLENTIRYMSSHLTHHGVHDHGFNTMSTYGNLLRMSSEGKIHLSRSELEHYRLAVKVSGAVQASRWQSLPENLGYIYSFNGPHSLFIDTMRTLRILIASHILGHVLMGENDEKISLLERSVKHALTTSIYNVYYGKGRDIYDERGRVAHESIFNTINGSYRCPSTQQGYSPFSTWTRGLAWAILGYAEQIEALKDLGQNEFESLEAGNCFGKESILQRYIEAATAVSDYYINNSPTDGIPYWDTGAPGLVKLGNWKNKQADPFNEYEPVDSSAAAIAAQGLIRLGKALGNDRYYRAGLTIAERLLNEPYLSTSKKHQGLLLHSVYHRPRGWDYIPYGNKIPCGESSMWGDYHLLELCLLIKKITEGGYMTFYHINSKP